MNDRRQREQQEYEIESARVWAKQHEAFGRTSLNVSEDVSLFAVKKAGNYYLDFVPYRVGKGNPDAAEGKVYWQRTYHVHRNVGAGNDTYCCPKRCTKGKQRCPVCEDVDEQFRTIDPALEGEALKKARSRIGAAAAKERQLFNVIDRNNPDKGIQVWEYSFHMFGKALKAKLDNMDPDDDFDLFFHPTKGKTVKITATEESGGSYTFFDCSIFEFKPRDPKEYDMKIVEEAHCLDDMPRVLTFEELLRVYLQIPDDEDTPDRGQGRGRSVSLSGRGRAAADNGDDDEPAPVRGVGEARRVAKQDVGRLPDDEEDAPPPRRKPAAREEEEDTPPSAPVKRRKIDDDDDEPAPAAAKGGRPRTAEEAGVEVGSLVYYKDLECEVTKVSRDGTSLTLEDDDAQSYMAVSPADVRLRTPKKAAPPPDDDEPAPPRRRGK